MCGRSGKLERPSRLLLANGQAGTTFQRPSNAAPIAYTGENFHRFPIALVSSWGIAPLAGY